MSHYNAKPVEVVDEETAASDNGEPILLQPDWTVEEETKAKRK
jgi:hypothetical protein